MILSAQAVEEIDEILKSLGKSRWQVLNEVFTSEQYMSRVFNQKKGLSPEKYTELKRQLKMSSLLRFYTTENHDGVLMVHVVNRHRALSDFLKEMIEVMGAGFERKVTKEGKGVIIQFDTSEDYTFFENWLVDYDTSSNDIERVLKVESIFAVVF